MESRLIYESSKTFKHKLNWTRKENSESEWCYFEKEELIEKLITDFFITDILHVALDRRNSFTENKDAMFARVKSLLGVKDFKIWNENFTKAIEINKIGVYRTGFAS